MNVKIKIFFVFSESFPHFRNIHCTTVQEFLFSRMKESILTVKSARSSHTQLVQVKKGF
jgi:hypothetical protein